MQYYRCKCGKSEAWTSMGVSECATCKHCGSDLAMGPEGHAETPAPHEYVAKYNEDTGIPYEVCRRCLRRRVDLEKPAEPEPPPPPPPDPYEGLVRQFPHCDAFVLHPAGTCEYCDLPKNKPLHDYRAAHGINHTGETDPTKKPCPAEERRRLSTIHRWPGNRPAPK